MRRLTLEEKQQLLRELREEGWKGNNTDESLMQLAEKVLDYQLR